MVATETVVISAISGVASLAIGLLIGYFAISHDSRSPEKDSNIKAIEKLTASYYEEDDHVSKSIINDMNSENIKENLRYLTMEPHVAGTPRDEILAKHIRDLWKDQGLDSSHLIPYKVLLSYPDDNKENTVQVVDGDGKVIFTALNKENMDGESSAKVIQAFNAFSPAGDVTAPLVYVNYARPQDFDQLESLGVNVTGKICIARYGKLNRGNKVSQAHTRGAVGVLLFLDPSSVAPQGSRDTDVYPNNWWMPKDAMQRGNIRSNKGDPETPGYPAFDDVYRLPLEETGLPKIPCQPIGYGDATQMLKNLGSHDIPEDWKGKINMTKIGPGFEGEFANRMVRMVVHNQYKRVNSYNVIGTIKGEIEPDRYVLYGNHRDAWGYGAVDPSSGTAQMLELTRVLGKLHREGWKPRRTLVFCSWGAEEFGLIGSSEWTEENLHKLVDRAVAYINVDICVMGDIFQAESSPMLTDVIMRASKMVPDADHSDKTIYDSWKAYQNEERDWVEEPEVLIPGSGTDHDPFYFYAGVPAVTIWWAVDEKKHKVGMYPAYHTAYDTFKLMSKFIDPNFKKHRGCAQISGMMLHILADSAVLPYDLNSLSNRMTKAVDNLENKEVPKLLSTHSMSLDLVKKAVSNFTDSTKKWHKKLLRSDFKNPMELRMRNDQMMMLERIFIKPEGLPGRPLTRHLIFAPSQFDSYSRGNFPAVTDLLYNIEKLPDKEKKIRLQSLERHLSDLMVSIRLAANFLEEPSVFQRTF